MYEKVKEQNNAKMLLTNAVVTNKINHCYIFSGNEGTGRFLLANEFAKSLICENASACDDCTACKQFVAGTTPDFKTVDLLIDKGKEKKAITVEQIREIVSDIYIKPSIFKKKLYIIKNADKMNVSAQNAILKSLEEPPYYVVFILIVENTDSLLPTILSRGTTVNFTPLTYKTIKEILKEKYDTTISDSLLPLCRGSVTEAYKISSSEEHKKIREDVILSAINFLGAKPEEKNPTLLKLYGCIMKYEKEKEFVFNVINTLLSDISKINENAGEYISNKDTDYKSVSLSTGQIFDIMNITFELLKRLNSNIKYNLAVLAALNDIKDILLLQRGN